MKSESNTSNLFGIVCVVAITAIIALVVQCSQPTESFQTVTIEDSHTFTDGEKTCAIEIDIPEKYESRGSSSGKVLDYLDSKNRHYLIGGLIPTESSESPADTHSIMAQREQEGARDALETKTADGHDALTYVTTEEDGSEVNNGLVSLSEKWSLVLGSNVDRETFVTMIQTVRVVHV